MQICSERGVLPLLALQLLCVRARDAICDAIRDARGTKPAPPERGSVADLPLFVTAYHDRCAAARGWVCNTCLSIASCAAAGWLPHRLRMLAAVALPQHAMTPPRSLLRCRLCLAG